MARKKKDPRVPMTTRVKKEVYHPFHQKTVSEGRTHNWVIVNLIELYTRGEITLPLPR